MLFAALLSAGAQPDVRIYELIYQVQPGSYGEEERLSEVQVRVGSLEKSYTPEGVELEKEAHLFQKPGAAVAALQEAVARLPYWIAVPEGKDTLYRAFGTDGAEFEVRDELGRCVERVWLSGGVLQEQERIVYPQSSGVEWASRESYFTASGRQERSLRFYSRSGAGGGLTGWWAAWGGQAYYELREGGALRYAMRGAQELKKGRWREERGQLLLSLEGQERQLGLYRADWGMVLSDTAGQRQEWVRPGAGELPQAWLEKPAAAEVFAENGRYGLRLLTGTPVWEAVYDEVKLLPGGLVLLQQDGLWGLGTVNGEAVTPVYFEALSEAGPGCFLAKRKGQAGLIDGQGHERLPFVYERLIWRGDTTFWMFREGEMGLIGQSGAILIPAAFDLIHPFEQGRAVAYEGERPGLIDESGNWLSRPGAYTLLERHGRSGYLVKSKDGLWGYISTDGVVRIPPVYMHLRPLSADVLAVQNNGRFGLLSVHGQELAPLKYRLLKGCGDYTATGGLCAALRRQGVVAQYINDEQFGYLDGFGRAFAPILPGAAELAADFQSVEALPGLVFYHREGWVHEPGIQRLYKRGDYGQPRVQYELLPSDGAEDVAAWAASHLEPGIDLAAAVLDGQPAIARIERERVQYYDFFRRHLYVMHGGKVLHLVFSCKDANFLESIPGLYELEQLVRLEKGP